MKVSCVVVCALALLVARFGRAESGSEKIVPPQSESESGSHCADCGIASMNGSGGPYVCPQFPIMTVSGGTIYYADLYDPDCDAEVATTYVVGSYDYPAECPNCLSGAIAKGPD